MAYIKKQLIITHSVPGTTARVNIFTLEAMDIALRMADRVGGIYDLSKITNRPEEKILYISFEDKTSLEIFKTLCY
mgnify:CR=1 FL=1